MGQSTKDCKPNKRDFLRSRQVKPKSRDTRVAINAPWQEDRTRLHHAEGGESVPFSFSEGEELGLWLEQELENGPEAPVDASVWK